MLHPACTFELISYIFWLLPQGSGEQSQELYTFHEAVSQLQDAEDKLVDDHRKNIEVKQLIQEPFESQPQLRQYGKKTWAVALKEQRHDCKTFSCLNVLAESSAFFMV